MTITHIELLSLPVTDQERAKSFYVDTLGFDLVRDVRLPDSPRWVQVAPKGAATSITLVTRFDSMPAGSVRGLVLETNDLDRDVAELKERGLPLDDDIEQAPWGRFVQFSDPDGNGIVLQATTARR